MIEAAHHDGLRATITLGTSFGCPFEGAIDPGRVLELAARFAHAGVDEVVFADTVGVGIPSRCGDLVGRGREARRPVGVHLHNTRNTGIANAWAAVEAGATVLDASVAGIGGCPFAPRATGNICTEDLVYLLHGEGVETGIDLDALVAIAEWLEGVLGRPLEGMVYKAGVFAPVAKAKPEKNAHRSLSTERHRGERTNRDGVQAGGRRRWHVHRSLPRQ